MHVHTRAMRFSRVRHNQLPHRRVTTRAGIAVIAVVAIASTTACSSSGSSAAGSTAGADVSAAQAAIAPYTGKPSAFPITEPLSKKLPSGTKFAFLQCSTTVCGLVAKVLQPAVAAIGGTFTAVNSGSTAQTSQAAASSLLALKPDVVLLSGIEPSIFGDSLKNLSSAGIKVVSISISKDVAPYGVTFNYIGADLTEQNGKLMADWVVANNKGADTVFYGVPAIEFSDRMQQSFEDELKKNCPSCKVRTVPIDVATMGKTSARTVVTDLQAHPSTTVAVFASSEVAAGLPAAMKAAGLKTATLGYAPTPGGLQDIKDGGLTEGLAVDLAVSIWVAVDAAARLVLGDQPTAGEKAGVVPTQFLGQGDITFDPSKGWTGYPDFPQRFATLWNPVG